MGEAVATGTAPGSATGVPARPLPFVTGDGEVSFPWAGALLLLILLAVAAWAWLLAARRGIDARPPWLARATVCSHPRDRAQAASSVQQHAARRRDPDPRRRVAGATAAHCHQWRRTTRPSGGAERSRAFMSAPRLRRLAIASLLAIVGLVHGPSARAQASAGAGKHDAGSSGSAGFSCAAGRCAGVTSGSKQGRRPAHRSFGDERRRTDLGLDCACPRARPQIRRRPFASSSG